MNKQSRQPAHSNDDDVPCTMLLPDRRTVSVLVPGEWCGRDRDGELTFKPRAVRLLDRIRVMALKMPAMPTPGFIRTLREALGLTQTQFGTRIGVDKLTVSRWERGTMKPGPRAVKALAKIRREAGRKGIVLAA